MPDGEQNKRLAYGLAMLQIKWLGPVTPLGGVLLIIGWLALAYGLWFELG